MPRRNPLARGRLRFALLALGLAAILTGVGLVVVPLVGVVQRGGTDQTALSAWTKGGSAALAGTTKDGTPPKKTLGCDTAGSPADYALVTFGAPAAEHYAGVATDGTWDSLHDRSMVHYTGTPGPGEKGNSIVAFHREPDFEHIDQLNVGDLVTVQDKNCHRFTYKISGKWVLDPAQVTQLVPTDGYDLTLITCTPFWVDSQRIIWRASLVTAAT
jgi:LPXTG-site transpeptidase (sortase) family protein